MATKHLRYKIWSFFSTCLPVFCFVLFFLQTFTQAKKKEEEEEEEEKNQKKATKH